MSAVRMECRPVADAILEECKEKSEKLRKQGVIPKLGILRVGDHDADLSYERGATRTMERAGAEVRVLALPGDATKEQYREALAELAADDSVHGILPFAPVPGLPVEEILASELPVEKDIDGMTSGNLGRLFLGEDGALSACTAAAIVAVIDFYGKEIRAITDARYKPLDRPEARYAEDPVHGLNVCIMGRSPRIGRPLLALLMNRGATVSVVHRRTRSESLPVYLGNADLVVAAATEENALRAEQIREGAVVIDAATLYAKEGSGYTGGKLIGCCAEDVWEKAAYVTPVPGLGSVTSAVLARNVLRAAERRNGG